MKKQEALEILQSPVGLASQQWRQPKISVTLDEFVRAEWKPNAALALKKSSMRIYSYQLDKHILLGLGSTSLRDVGRAQIEACLSRLKVKGHATSTLRSIRATFSTVLQAGVERVATSKRILLMASAFAKRIRKKSGGSIRPRRSGCFWQSWTDLAVW